MVNLTRTPLSIFDKYFNDFDNAGFYIKPLHGDANLQNFKVDIKENKKTIKVHAEIPGVNKEDIHVDVNGKYLTITAEVKQLDEKKDDERVIRSERYYGSISRSVQLPSEVDMKKSSAKYQNGVLDISLGKNANKDLSKIKVT